MPTRQIDRLMDRQKHTHTLRERGRSREAERERVRVPYDIHLYLKLPYIKFSHQTFSILYHLTIIRNS